MGLSRKARTLILMTWGTSWTLMKASTQISFATITMSQAKRQTWYGCLQEQQVCVNTAILKIALAFWVFLLNYLHVWIIRAINKHISCNCTCRYPLYCSRTVKDQSCHGCSSIAPLNLCDSIICGVAVTDNSLVSMSSWLHAGKSNRWEESFSPDNDYQLCPHNTMP